ncbi:hypothetical protein TFLX_01678 [Thermoflexales bacterium]|nr:hypothetical protein TFLX_01678 [Thermoflexales bacterium]
MNRLFPALLLGSVALICLACTPAQQPAVSTTRTPTPTPTPLLPAGGTSTPTIAPTPHPTGGEIELRFTDPETQEECEAHFPFTINWGEARTTIEGSGVIDCAFDTQQCGEACVTYHSAYTADASLSGELLASSAKYPHGFLNAGLAGKFSMKQYWTDIPPGAFMAFTEDNPAVFEGSDILPLIFDFVEGATCETGGGTGTQTFPWKFTLHLD